MSIALNDESSHRWTQIDCELILKRNGRNLENMLKCLQIEAKIFWLMEDSKVIFILFIVIIIPNIQLSRHQETKIQSLFKTTPQQLINLINLLPFWNQFNQTELMFSPLVAPSFPQALYTLWKTYKQARVFFLQKSDSKFLWHVILLCGASEQRKLPPPRLTHSPTCVDYRPKGDSLLNLGVLC